MFGGGFGTTNNNNQQQQQQQQPQTGFGAPAAPTGFGFGQTGATGFGAAPAATTGFGAPAAPTGFGAPQATTGFGMGAPAQPTGFGATTTFGAPAPAATGLGAFGQPAASTTTATGFGATGGMFGQPAPPANTGFGATTNTGWGTQPAAPATGFGATTTGFGGTTGAQSATGFGAPKSAFGGLGGATTTATTFGGTTAGGFGGAGMAGTQTTSATVNNGTGTPSYQTTSEKDPVNPLVSQIFQSISAMQPYKTWSFEELRLKDYESGRKFAGTMFNQPAAPQQTTSLFGQPQTATTGFGQPQQQQQPQTGFGQPQQQTGGLFGQPAATTAPFGQAATQQTGGLFGQQPQQTTAVPFGQTTTTGGGLFGQPQQQQQQPFGGIAGATQPQQPTGLFGQPGAAPTTAPFGQQATTPFGATQPQQQTTGSIFNKPFGATTTTGFGAPTAQPAAPTTTFGQPAATAAPTGLFGQQQQTTTAPFGQTSTAGTGLFGAKPPGTPFGQPAAPAANAPFGQPFGQQQQQQQPPAAPAAPSLFGQPQTQAAAPFSLAAPPKLGGLFGAPTTTTTQPTTTPSLFGQPQQTQQPATTSTGGGLFQSSLFKHTTTAAPTTTTSNMSSLFAPAASTAQQQPALTATVDADAYGAAVLLQPKTTAPTASGAPTAPTATPQEKAKRPVAVPQYRLFPTPKVDRRLAPTPAKQTDGLSSGVVYRTDGFRRSVKKLDMNAVKSTPLQAPPSTRKVTFDTPLTSKQVPMSAMRDADASFASPSPVKKLDFSAASPAPQPKITITEPTPVGQTSTPLAVKTTEEEHLEPSDLKYTVTPSLHALSKLTAARLAAVPNFTISHKDHGSVRWLDAVDLTAFENLVDVPGNVVKMMPKMCSVYDDSDYKHPIGTGLNRPAEIALRHCQPLDKATKAPLRDSEAVARHVERLKNIEGTKFISYEPVDGLWTFQVEHFSRYGLPDNFDDDEEMAQATPVSSPPFDARMDIIVDSISLSRMTMPEAMGLDRARVMEMRKMFPRPTSALEPELIVEKRQKGDELNFTPAVSRFQNAVQDSFQFSMETTKVDVVVEEPTNVAKNVDFAAERPRTVGAQKLPMVPFGESVMASKPIHITGMGRSFRVGWAMTDAGMTFVSVHGTRAILTPVNVGAWSSTNRTVNQDITKDATACLDVQLAKSIVSNDGVPAIKTGDISFSDMARPITFVAGMKDAAEKVYKTEHDAWTLASALFDPLPGDEKTTDASFAMDVTMNDQEGANPSEQIRKDRFSAWLKLAVKDVVETDLAQESDPIAQIFILLTGRRIKDAVELALKSRCFRLATILAQLSDGGGANMVYSGSGGLDLDARDLLYSQLQNWLSQRLIPSEPNKNGLISAAMTRVYRLLCSDLDEIHKAVKLDWKRTLGLYFWYFATSGMTLSEALGAYEFAFKDLRGTSAVFSANISRPLPWYQNETNQQEEKNHSFDVLYEIIKLYAKDQQTLDAALSYSAWYPSPPSKATTLNLNAAPSVRFAWHFWRIMKARSIRVFGDEQAGVEDADGSFSMDLGMDGSFAVATAANETASATGSQLTLDYATELESIGQWNWAIFVLMHLASPQAYVKLLQLFVNFSRELLICQVLARNVAARLADEFTPAAWTAEEAFVLERLRVSPSWLFIAKATVAHASGNDQAEVIFLARAERHQDAHDLMLRRLLPQAFVRGDVSKVNKLISLLAADKVNDYHVGAGMFADYFSLLKRDVEAKIGDVVDLLKRLGSYESKRKSGDASVRVLTDSVHFRACLSVMSSAVSQLLMRVESSTSQLMAQASAAMEAAPVSSEQRLDLVYRLTSDYFSPQEQHA